MVDDRPPEQGPDQDAPHRRSRDGLEHLGPPTLGDVLGLGRDLHVELERVESRVTGAIVELREDFEGFQVEHRDQHTGRTVEVNAALERLHQRLNAYDLEQAKRQGAFGVLRWTVELFGRNWKLVATAALAAATLLGNISIVVEP